MAISRRHAKRMAKRAIKKARKRAVKKAGVKRTVRKVAAKRAVKKAAKRRPAKRRAPYPDVVRGHAKKIFESIDEAQKIHKGEQHGISFDDFLAGF